MTVEKSKKETKKKKIDCFKRAYDFYVSLFLVEETANSCFRYLPRWTRVTNVETTNGHEIGVVKILENIPAV